MANGDLHLLGTLFTGSTKQLNPTRPWRNDTTVPGQSGTGNIPAYPVGQTIEIRNTDSMEAYKIRWREVNVGSKKMLVADRNLLHSISWDDLNAQGLITGKTVTIDGQQYKLRMLTGGSNYRSGTDAYSGGSPAANEWDQIITNESNYSGLPKPVASDLDSTANATDMASAHNQYWNWFYMYSWAQETYTGNGANRAVRGYYSARYWLNGDAANRYASIGWRPALEVLNSAPLISGKDEDLGGKKAPFSVVYNVSEPDGDTFSIVEKVNGVQVKKIDPAVSGQNYELILDIGTWSAVPTNTTSTLTIEATDSKGLKSTRTYTFTKTNQEPSVTLNTTNNQTLYENGLFTIDGAATDTDNGNIVNAKYRIDAGSARALTVSISDGSTPIPFSKVLTFKRGRLYDGDTAVTEVLSDGVPHTLTVWAEDDQTGKSADQLRTFFVVSNRPPGLTFDTVDTTSGLIGSDAVAITGNVSDPEGQDVRVRYDVNGGTTTEFYNGAPGPIAFNIPLEKLKDGENTVTVQAVDTYDFITTKKLMITKTFNATKLLNGVARYKVTPPADGVQDLVAWIEHDTGDLEVSMDASMILSGEQEQFEPMNLTASVDIGDNLTERDFRISSLEIKDTVAIKIALSRSDKYSTASVKKVTGTML